MEMIAGRRRSLIRIEEGRVTLDQEYTCRFAIFIKQVTYYKEETLGFEVELDKIATHVL